MTIGPISGGAGNAANSFCANRTTHRLLALAAALCAATLAHANSLGLTINATFDPSLTAAEQAEINMAIATAEADISSPHNIAVSIYFNSMNSGLGESVTAADRPLYYDFYNALLSVATQPGQLSALASLGAPPASTSSLSPVPGTGNRMYITTAEARNLGFTGFGTTPGIPVNSVLYDGEILLNTSLTSAPGPLNGSTYSLQSVAAHEIDEVLGIGGPGTTLGTGNSAQTGALDLFRFSAAGVRSHTTSTSAPSYFSMDGGQTILSFFNQSGSGDYADWAGSSTAQVQDAYSTPGVDIALGTNELAALNSIGYQVMVTPETGTFVLAGAGLLGLGLVSRRKSADRG